MFEKDGSLVREWGSKGESNGQFDYPCGVAIDDTCVYVVDSLQFSCASIPERW